MQLGIMTPILSWRAGAPDWVQQGGIDDVAEIVGAAERLGYAFCTCSEHAALTRGERERRSWAYWDPLASFSYLAARTSSIHLVTWLVVLGYHHPVALAKRYGQLDLMSNGRLVLGVGVGTLKEEFALLGAPFEDRGPRADDAIRAIRAIWGQPWATYAGTHYDFADWWVMPHAPRTKLPILVGGRTRRSLRRAIELGDGWAPFALNLDQIQETLAWGRSLDGWAHRGETRFEVLARSPRLDPSGDPSATRAHLEAAVTAGVTQWGAEIVGRSAQHYLEQLDALQQVVTGHTR